MERKKTIKIGVETWFFLRDIMRRHNNIFSEEDAILFLLRLQGYGVPERIPYPNLVYLPNKDRWVEA